MRASALLVAVFVLFVASSAATGDVRDPGMVNKILTYGTFETPDIEPGQQGIIAFNLTNPYNKTMADITLNVSIYEYAEQEVSRVVDSSWSYDFPKFESAAAPGREKTFLFASLASNSSTRVSLTVLTSEDMPHGGLFSQGAYLIRFWLEFRLDGIPVWMASPGYWSKQQLIHATADQNLCNPTDCVGDVNLTRLGGVDGILPDTAFGVKSSVPMWPFYAAGTGAIFFLLLAFLYYAEENPSKLPRTARAFASFKGKLVRVFRPRKGAKT